MDMKRVLLLFLLALAFPILAGTENPGSAVGEKPISPFEIVKKASSFDTGLRGPGVDLSEEEVALREIVKQNEGVVLCWKLLSEATMEGQMYGLLGLQFLDKAAFQEALPRYKEVDEKVRTGAGCSSTSLPAKYVVAWIDRGQYRTNLAAPGTPFETVKRAGYFSVGRIGFAGQLSSEEIAFRKILEQPDAVVLCQKLLSEATKAGQLYGLLGLFLRDKEAFQAALPRYKEDREQIKTYSGCTILPMSAFLIAHRIEKGRFE